EGLDPLMVDIDVAQIIELLQHEMAGVVQKVRSRMLANTVEEHLEAGAVAEVLTRVDLIADVNAALIKSIENRTPARGQFIECSFDQPRWPLGPGVQVGPCQSAAEGGMGLQPQPARRLGGLLQLLDRPRG